MTSILLLRAEPAATQTKQALRKHGHQVIKLPLFEIHTNDTAIPQIKYDGLILTSRNAAGALKMRNWLSPDPSMPVFCVGRQTAQAAAELGFGNIIAGPGGAAALADLVIKTILPDKARILYPAAKHRAFDFSSPFELSNLSLDTIEIYEMQKLVPAPRALEGALRQIGRGVVFIYSARSAEYFAGLIKRQDLTRYTTDITLIAISANAAGPLQNLPFHQIIIAARADETAMIGHLTGSTHG